MRYVGAGKHVVVFANNWLLKWAEIAMWAIISDYTLFLYKRFFPATERKPDSNQKYNRSFGATAATCRCSATPACYAPRVRCVSQQPDTSSSPPASHTAAQKTLQWPVTPSSHLRDPGFPSPPLPTLENTKAFMIRVHQTTTHYITCPMSMWIWNCCCRLSMKQAVSIIKNSTALGQEVAPCSDASAKAHLVQVWESKVNCGR